MAHQRLTERFVRELRTPGKYTDLAPSFGLALVCKPVSRQKHIVPGAFRKSWIQRLTYEGRTRDRGLGRWPVLTLAEARKLAAGNYALNVAGGDPFEDKRPGSGILFRDATEQTIAHHGPDWSGAKTEKLYRSSMERYVLPKLGRRPVAAIQTPELVQLLTPLMREKPATGEAVKQRISTVFNWCVANGHRSDNPAGRALSSVLPTNGGRAHRPSLPHGEVGAALERIATCEAHGPTRLALRFLILTAARSGEVRGARWDEFDLDAKIWTVPAGRIKSRREHQVPLSGQALEVLAEAQKSSECSDGLVFPSPRGKVLGDHLLSQLVKDLGIQATPHGFRSSFRDWCGETGRDREVAEHCLAHAVGNATERAYARSTMLERRRALMADWADYVSQAA